MPIAGGVYTRSDGVRTGTTVNVTAKAAGVKCTAALADTRENDFAAAINQCIYRDGSNAATDDLDLGSHKITALEDGSGDTDAATKGQMDAAIAAMFSTYGASLALAADATSARAILTPFSSGTIMPFGNSTAPDGWTKQTTHNDKALRVVSGTPSSGGSVSFSSAFASITPTGTVAGHALTAAENGTHSHGYTDPGHAHSYYQTVHSGQQLTSSTSLSYSDTTSSTSTNTIGITIQNSGSGDAHTHGWTGNAINLAVAYVDLILASKD
jgi:hypothetical protein